jgi:hypothetical protein
MWSNGNSFGTSAASIASADEKVISPPVPPWKFGVSPDSLLGVREM